MAISFLSKGIIQQLGPIFMLLDLFFHYIEYIHTFFQAEFYIK